MQAIRNLLITEHGKFFNKAYYKQADPFIGKRSDILNKMAIASLFQDKQQQAEKLWEEAFALNEKHFDTRVNYAMYRWKYALITDDELKLELQDQVFTNKHKGHSLLGIINIALGEKEEGLRILETYNDQQRVSQIVNDPSENIRRRKARENAKEIYQEVNLRRGEYTQNAEVQTEHQDTIHHIQVTPNGTYMTTASPDQVVVWQLWPEIKALTSVRVQPDEPEEDMRVVACVDEECTMLAIYERDDLIVKLYNLDFLADPPTATAAGDFDMAQLFEDIHEELQDGKELPFEGAERIVDMKFIEGGSSIRIYVEESGVPFFLDFSIDEQEPVCKRAKKWEDKSIFKFGHKFIK